MEQNTLSQYDDDLTVGMEEAEDFLDTGFVDLFEHSSSNGSPISRLKTIVLSIDWEINNEILTQFNDELLVLKDVWKNDQVKLVYVQALEKISKYIYQFKADAHPNAIKLLLTFYYNLEKIVLETTLSDAEVKDILRGDVKKFEQLKQKIGIAPASGKPGSEDEAASAAHAAEQVEQRPVLFNLKACILGMDWEITERELADLGNEVTRLEKEFAGRKPQLILLQGIAALGGYIKLKKSDAHADAFRLLYSLYEGLEKIVVNPNLSKEAIKEILLPEVEKFEDFKQVIAATITPEAIAGKIVDEESSVSGEDESVDAVAPAFSDMPEEIHGFQAEEEAATLGASSDVEDRLDTFLAGEESSDAGEKESALPPEAIEKIDSFFGDDLANDALSLSSISPEDALKGVDVETDADDDSDEEALPTRGDGLLAPALADSGDSEPHGFNPDAGGEESLYSAAEVDESLGDIFADDPAQETVSQAAALQGVNVETDADDDSDEQPLPTEEDDIAPALALDDAVFEIPEDIGAEDEVSEIDAQIETFFGDVGDDEVVDAGEDSIPETPFDQAAEEEPADDGVVDAGEDSIPETPFDQAAEEEPADDGVVDAGEDSIPETPFDQAAEEEPADDFAEISESHDAAPKDVQAGIDTFFAEPEETSASSTPFEIFSEPARDGVEGVEVSADEGREDELPIEVEEPEDQISLVDDGSWDDLPEDGVSAVEPPADSEVSLAGGEEELHFEAVGEEAFVDAAEEIPLGLLDDEPDIEAQVDAQPGFETVAEDGAEEQIESEEAFWDEGIGAESFADEDGARSFDTAFEEDEKDRWTPEEIPSLEQTAAEDENVQDSQITDPIGLAASSFGSDSEEEAFFAAIDNRIDEPGEIQIELLAESDAVESELVTDHDEEGDGDLVQELDQANATAPQETLVEEPGDELEAQPFALDDELSGLRAGVASLGVEINERIVDGLLTEINQVRQRMVSRPVEKTFLQLLSTIVQHIGHYKYESSSEAHTLMLSVFDKLELSQKDSVSQEQSQEALLTETCKVLLWQQKMLDRQVVKNKDELSFVNSVSSRMPEVEKELAADEYETQAAPVPEPHGDSEQDFSAVFEPVDEEDFAAVEEIEATQEGIEQELGDALSRDDSQAGGEAAGDTDKLVVSSRAESKLDIKGLSVLLSGIVKREMKSLKDLLQTELKSLKDKFRDKD